MDIHKLGIIELSHRCAEESGRYFRGERHEPRFCYELFRRAFVEKDQLAWDHLYIVYKPLIIGWVTSNPAFPSCGEEVGYFVNRALEKMWLSISSEKFDHFGEVSALLCYLKMCVGSVIVDHKRMHERLKLTDLNEALDHMTQGGGSPAKEQVENLNNPVVLWDLIQGLVTNRREKYVVLGCFVYNLKPREILIHYPEEFTDVKEIYRTKENLIARLRRNPAVVKSLRDYIGETR